MLARALKLELGDTEFSFADQKQTPVWARPYVTTAAEAGLIKGNGDGKFNPNASSTKAEAVTLILAMLNSKK